MNEKKPRTVYIFEGEDSIAILKGYPYEVYEGDDGHRLVKAKVRYKGLFKKYVDAINIDKTDIGVSKKLIYDDKPMPGWEVVRVNQDFVTARKFNPNYNAMIQANVQSLVNELNYYKRLYYEEKRKNMDRTQKERYKRRQEEEAKHAGKIRSLILSPSEQGFGGGFYGSGFGTRFGGFGGGGENI